jgi:hypothetical protein
MMLAQITAPSSMEFGGWLFCLGAAFWIANQGKKLFMGDKKTEIQQPLVVKGEKECLEVDRHENFAAAVANEQAKLHQKIGGVDRAAREEFKSIRDEMHAMELRLNEKGEERSDKLHDRITEILGEMRELKGKTNHD